MKQEKKVNSYLRAIKMIALACVIGGVIGGVTGAIRFVLLSRGVAVSGDWVLQQIRSLLVPILGIIFAVTVILEELCFHKLKGICEKQITAEDEECDQLEYEEEKTGAFGTNLNVLSQVVSIFFLTFGYSMKYIEADDHAYSFLVACVIFVVSYIYIYFWQIRYVKLLQKTHPEKKGDPSSTKFQEQWLESCDEAEKEVIYQSAYKAYVTINRTIPLILIVVMVANLYFDTGMMAVVVLAVVWMLAQFTYTGNCVKMKKNSLLFQKNRV